MKSLHVAADSISVHYGPYLKNRLEGRFQYSRKGHHATIRSRSSNGARSHDGANGGDSGQLLEYLRICVEEHQMWDVLVLNAGLHDVRRRSGELQVNLDHYVRNAEAVLLTGLAIARKVVWIRTTPVSDGLHNRLTKRIKRYDDDVVRYNAAVDKLVDRMAVPSIDLYGFTRDMNVDRPYVDHVHFTKDVRRQQAAFVAEQLCQHAA